MKSIIIIAALVGAVLAYPTGAPQTVCYTLYPGHGDSQQQTTPAPYAFIVPEQKLVPGGTITLTLRGKTTEDLFKGVMVQARETDVPIGQFQIINPESTKLMDCGNPGVSFCITNDGGVSRLIFNFIPKDTITHNNADDKREVSFKWTALSDFTGTVRFHWTVVKSFSTFWVMEQSAPLVVAAN